MSLSTPYKPYNVKLSEVNTPNSAKAICTNLFSNAELLFCHIRSLVDSDELRAFQGTLIFSSTNFNVSLLQAQNASYLPYPLSHATTRARVRTLFINNTLSDAMQHQIMLGDIAKLRDLFPNIERIIIVLNADKAAWGYAGMNGERQYVLRHEMYARDILLGTLRQFLVLSERQARAKVSIPDGVKVYVVAAGTMRHFFEEENDDGRILYTGEIFRSVVEGEDSIWEDDLKVRYLERRIEGTYVKEGDEHVRPDARSMTALRKKVFGAREDLIGRFVLDHVLD